jgi:hypothetical protein
MANTKTNEQTTQIDEDPNQELPSQAAEEEEFKITVKKLDFAVKPRGVLAE